MPDSTWMLDQLVADYAEVLWEEGESQYMYSDTICALVHHLKFLKRQMIQSWDLLSTWQLHELPTRATPFSLDVVLAMAGAALQRGWLDMAVGLLLAFQALLRTGELLNLTCGDFQFGKVNCVVFLGLTKGGRRRNESESVVVCDDALISLLRLITEPKQRGERLVPAPTTFRRRFDTLLRDVGLQDKGYKPYSLRRGGATHTWLVSGNMALTTRRGRWQNQSTCKIYVQEAATLATELTFSPSQMRRIGRFKALCVGTLTA